MATPIKVIRVENVALAIEALPDPPDLLPPPKDPPEGEREEAFEVGPADEEPLDDAPPPAAETTLAEGREPPLAPATEGPRGLELAAADPCRGLALACPPAGLLVMRGALLLVVVVWMIGAGGAEEGAC